MVKKIVEKKEKNRDRSYKKLIVDIAGFEHVHEQLLEKARINDAFTEAILRLGKIF